MEGYLTVNDIMDKTGFSRVYINRLCNNGTFPGAKKLSHIWIIPQSDFDLYVSEKLKKDSERINLLKQSI